MIMRRLIFCLLAVAAQPLTLYAQTVSDDCHDPATWQHIREMSYPGEVHGNIEVCINDRRCGGAITEINVGHGIFIFADELAVREFVPATQKLQSILARGDIDAFVGLSSERFLDLLRKRYVAQLGKKAPPRKGFREFWRKELRSGKDPLRMSLLFTVKKEWQTDSWWRVEYELPVEYKGKNFPAFSVIVCFNREGKGPFQHVAFTFVKEKGKYLLIDFDDDWDENAGPFFGRQYGL